MGSLFEFLGGLVTIAKTWFTGKNSADEVANKKAANDQTEKAKVESDIAKGNAQDVGKDIST